MPRTKLVESFAEKTELARRKDLAFNHFRLNEDRQRYSFLRSKAHLGARLQSGANGTVLGPQRGSVASGLQKMSHGNNVGFGSRVRLLPTLSTRQNILRKQTESLQCRERRMYLSTCSIIIVSVLHENAIAWQRREGRPRAKAGNRSSVRLPPQMRAALRPLRSKRECRSAIQGVHASACLFLRSSLRCRWRAVQRP